MLHAVAESALRAYSRVAPTGRGAYRLVRMARRLRRTSRWTDDFITPDRIRMRLDLGVYPDCCMAFGLYELDTARWIKQLLKPGAHFVDGGANIGYFTLMAARRVGESGRIDAFEPQPDNLRRLKAHLKENGLAGRVNVHAEALSDHAGQATIHFYQDAGANHGCSTLFAESGRPTLKTVVPTVRLDERLAGTRPDLIKLDIEGAEALAISGMTRLLQSDQPPALILENNPRTAEASNTSADEPLRLILGTNPRYQIWRIGHTLTRVDPKPAILRDLGQVNLLARID